MTELVPHDTEGVRLPEPGAPRPTSRRTRVLLWVGGVLAALVIIALALYDFGGPSGVTDEVRAQYATLVAAGEVPPIEQRFTIPIPGCRCHSDDPVVIMQHSERRIRDCAGCH